MASHEYLGHVINNNLNDIFCKILMLNFVDIVCTKEDHLAYEGYLFFLLIHYLNGLNGLYGRKAIYIIIIYKKNESVSGIFGIRIDKRVVGMLNIQ